MVKRGAKQSCATVRKHTKQLLQLSLDARILHCAYVLVVGRHLVTIFHLYLTTT